MDELLIIGGNAAGMTAASRARRLDPNVRIAVLEKGPHISYSTCGIPYFLSGTVPANRLISFTPETLASERNIRALTNMRADAIEPARKRVLATNTATGEKEEFGYGRLLIATGVTPRTPEIPGTDLANVHTLVDLEDGMRIRESLSGAGTIGVVGAGYVGLEVTEALRSLGKTVHLFEAQTQVLPVIDVDMAQVVEYELQRFGVHLHTGAKVQALVGAGGRVSGIKTASSLGVQPVDLVLMDTGVRPSSDLARRAGVVIGATGGIAVNPYLETSITGIFAAGNCTETWCAIRRRPVLHYVGTAAAKQGRIAGENMAGGRAKFEGTVGTTILRVFELHVGRTGLSLREAGAERIPVVTSRIEDDDRASYFPGARKIWVKLMADRESRRLIGAQVVGYGDVAKRIDVAATAITCGMRVDELAQLDLAYSPPYSSLWDPLHVAAQALLRQF